MTRPASSRVPWLRLIQAASLVRRAKAVVSVAVLMLLPYTYWYRYVKRCRLIGMDDSAIEHELTEAQADVIKARKAPARRRRAVMLARENGWSKYRIAATLGVKGPTVDSIIAAAERKSGE